jgi:hypothetical protein
LQRTDNGVKFKLTVKFKSDSFWLPISLKDFEVSFGEEIESKNQEAVITRVVKNANPLNQEGLYVQNIGSSNANEGPFRAENVPSDFEDVEDVQYWSDSEPETSCHSRTRPKGWPKQNQRNFVSFPIISVSKPDVARELFPTSVWRDTELKKNKHGCYGVFASYDIPKGTILGFVGGIIQQLSSLSSLDFLFELPLDISRAISIQDKLFLDCSEYFNEARFVKSSESHPNLEFVLFSPSNTHKSLVAKTLVHVRRGDELIVSSRSRYKAVQQESDSSDTESDDDREERTGGFRLSSF